MRRPCRQLEPSNIDDVKAEGSHLVNMGLAYGGLGEPLKAIALFEKALQVGRRLGDLMLESSALANIGLAYANVGEYAKAIEFGEKQLQIARRIGDAMGEGNVLGTMGIAYAKMRNKEEATRCFRESRVIFERLGLQHKIEALESIAKNAGI